MPVPEVTILVEARTDLGEAPTWDARTQRLYFVDINAKKVHVYDWQSQEHFSVDAPEMVGTVVLTDHENVILAAMHRDVVALDVGKRKWGPVLATTPQGHGVDQMRFNDGKGSPGGEFILGRMHAAWRKGRPGRLYRVDLVKGTFEELLSPDETTLPNGMAWDSGMCLMYFVDTAACNITAYRTDGAGVPVRGLDGHLEKAHTFGVDAEVDGAPDGMTIDRDGNLWVALAEGSAVACYRADTGKQLQKVKLPVKRVTACTFGGPGLEQLLVTTRVESGEGASEHWGSVLAVRIPGIAGAAGAYPVRLPTHASS